MRVFVMCVLAASLVACGGASPDIVETFNGEDTGSITESGGEVQTAESGAPDTVTPPPDTGTDTQVAEVFVDTGTDTGVVAETSSDETSADTAPAPDTLSVADTADTSPALDTATSVDSTPADSGTSADTADTMVMDTSSADTYVPPADTGSTDTYVPPADTAPACMYASTAPVVTGDSSAVMLNGTFMCYEMRVRFSSFPTGNENIFVTSNTKHLRVFVDDRGVVTMMVNDSTLVFSGVMTAGVWHTVAACKVPDPYGKTDVFRLQVFIDGVGGDYSMSVIPLSVVFAPGALTFGWAHDYDRVRIYKRDGTMLAKWDMDGNANDTGPTKLNATGFPTYTAMTCP